jgi:uroporphyrinogen-III synthase
MSKKTKSATNQPLSGIRVLVGRARHQAGVLSTQLRKLGASVIQIPFIEIRKPRSFQPLDSALKNLHAYDWLILTSVNGVEAMWQRMAKLHLLGVARNREGRAEKSSTRPSALAAEGSRRKRLHIAAIGPATKKAIERRGVKVDVVPQEYVAESVVRSLEGKVKGNRVLLVRAKVARDVIPRELRRAGAQVDVVEAYEIVAPQFSRARLRAALNNPRRRPHVVTLTSSSTARNFVELLGGSRQDAGKARKPRGRGRPRHTDVARAHTSLHGILMASIGPVTSSTLRELGLPVDIEAGKFTIPGLVDAIARAMAGCAK